MVRVLIADDEAEIRDVLRQFFERHGYSVDCVVDGLSAVALALSGQYDAVILDCRMPGMSGLEVARAVRCFDGSVAATPLIGISGLLDDVRKECLDAGMNAFLAKPFSLEALLEKVEECRRS